MVYTLTVTDLLKHVFSLSNVELARPQPPQVVVVAPIGNLFDIAHSALKLCESNITADVFSPRRKQSDQHTGWLLTFLRASSCLGLKSSTKPLILSSGGDGPVIKRS